MRAESSTHQVNSFEQLGRTAKSSNASPQGTSQYLNRDAYKVELSSAAQFANTDKNELYRQIQDSASIIQTAEDGAKQTESLLTRIQEIVDKANSEELTDAQRESMQEEIDGLTAEIDRVALLTQDKIQKILANSSISAENPIKLTNLPEELAAQFIDLANQNKLNCLPFDINCTGDKELFLQIGANPGQAMRLEIRAMNSKKLGLAGIDVTNHDNAVKAVKTIDDAIEGVSRQRAGMGATIRCLEHTINYLTSMRDNLAEAESRIRDVDIAKEYSEFVKSSIQNKIAGAIMAQANMRPRMVLELLEII